MLMSKILAEVVFWTNLQIVFSNVFAVSLTASPVSTNGKNISDNITEIYDDDLEKQDKGFLTEIKTKLRRDNDDYKDRITARRWMIPLDRISNPYLYGQTKINVRNRQFQTIPVSKHTETVSQVTRKVNDKAEELTTRPEESSVLTSVNVSPLSTSQQNGVFIDIESSTKGFQENMGPEEVSLSPQVTSYRVFVINTDTGLNDTGAAVSSKGVESEETSQTPKVKYSVVEIKEKSPFRRSNDHHKNRRSRLYIQEQGENGVALLSLGDGPLPPILLSKSRRQYMSDLDDLPSDGTDIMNANSY